MNFWNGRTIVFCGLSAACISVLSPLSLPVPGSPVPVSLQTLALSGNAILFGRLAVLPVLIYLLAGLIGLPVFAGFNGGPAALFGPTGGFLLGFIPFNAFLGWRWSNREPSRLEALLLLLMAHLILYLPGLLWLKLYLSVDIPRVLALGMLPFLPGDFLKIALTVANHTVFIRVKRRFFS
ncbi:MAG: biotin transporter BioY [Candidatus Wallbacteria bacterium]|nr:biotin transporter BioY [Candidatus Wallbacteria bacterium]